MIFLPQIFPHTHTHNPLLERDKNAGKNCISVGKWKTNKQLEWKAETKREREINSRSSREKCSNHSGWCVCVDVFVSAFDGGWKKINVKFFFLSTKKEERKLKKWFFIVYFITNSKAIFYAKKVMSGKYVLSFHWCSLMLKIISEGKTCVCVCERETLRIGYGKLNIWISILSFFFSFKMGPFSIKNTSANDFRKFKFHLSIHSFIH